MSYNTGYAVPVHQMVGEELRQFEVDVTKACQVITTFADQQNLKIQDVRSLYIRGELSCEPSVSQALKWMVDNENRALACFAKMAFLVAKRSHLRNKRTKVELDDFVSEAMIAIHTAYYSYNGSNRLSTYMMCCIRNRMIGFSKTIQKRGISVAATQVHNKIRAIMNEHNCSYDEAESMLRAKEQGSGRLYKNARSASVQVVCFSELELTDIAKTPSEDINEFADINIAQVIENADLSDLQKRLLNALLTEQKGFIAYLSENEINPRTGRHWTRQWLHVLQDQAIEKLRKYYKKEMKEVA